MGRRDAIGLMAESGEALDQVLRLLSKTTRNLLSTKRVGHIFGISVTIAIARI